MEVENIDIRVLSPIWKCVVAACISNSNFWPGFKSNSRVVVVNGYKSSFWHDNWTFDQPLFLSILGFIPVM